MPPFFKDFVQTLNLNLKWPFFKFIISKLQILNWSTNGSIPSTVNLISHKKIYTALVSIYETLFWHEIFPAICNNQFKQYFGISQFLSVSLFLPYPVAHFAFIVCIQIFNVKSLSLHLFYFFYGYTYAHVVAAADAAAESLKFICFDYAIFVLPMCAKKIINKENCFFIWLTKWLRTVAMFSWWKRRK